MRISKSAGLLIGEIIIKMTEEALKDKLKKVSKDSSWSGRVIGYKLVPILEAEERTVLKCFKKTTITKIKKKRGRPKKKFSLKGKKRGRGRPRKK